MKHTLTEQAAEQPRVQDDLRRAREMLGLAVFAIAEGKRIGEVSALMVRREDRSVAVLGISSGTFSATRYLPFARIASVGADAVMVENEAALQADLMREEREALDARITGRRVITESGQSLGEIAGYEVNTSNGRIELFRIQLVGGSPAWLAPLAKQEVIEVSDTRVVALGSDVLIVRDEVVASSNEPAAGSEPSP